MGMPKSASDEPTEPYLSVTFIASNSRRNQVFDDSPRHADTFDRQHCRIFLDVLSGFRISLLALHFVWGRGIRISCDQLSRREIRLGSRCGHTWNRPLHLLDFDVSAR